MDDRHPKGTAAAVNPGVNGGAATHVHTSPGHLHTGVAHTHAGTTDTGPIITRANRIGSDILFHNHTYTSGSLTPSSDNTVATWNSTSSNPAAFRFIFLKSNGTRPGFPNGSVAYWNKSTAPANWIQHVASKDRFPLGAVAAGDGGGTTGGAHTHDSPSHTHLVDDHTHGTVTSSTTPAGSNIRADAGSVESANVHSHSISFDDSGSATSGGTASAITGSTTHEPSFHRLLGIENNSGSDDLPIQVIAMWLQTLASIPDRWLLCDGTLGTPDLRDKFIKIANVGGDVGATGGTLGHDHTDPAGHDHSATAHTHTQNATAAHTNSNFTTAIMGCAKNHTHAAKATDSSGSGTLGSTAQTVDSTADTEPLFRTVAYLQYAGLEPIALGAAF